MNALMTHKIMSHTEKLEALVKPYENYFWRHDESMTLKIIKRGSEEIDKSIAGELYILAVSHQFKTIMSYLSTNYKIDRTWHTRAYFELIGARKPQVAQTFHDEFELEHQDYYDAIIVLLKQIDGHYKPNHIGDGVCLYCEELAQDISPIFQKLSSNEDLATKLLAKMCEEIEFKFLDRFLPHLAKVEPGPRYEKFAHTLLLSTVGAGRLDLTKRVLSTYASVLPRAKIREAMVKAHQAKLAYDNTMNMETRSVQISAPAFESNYIRVLRTLSDFMLANLTDHEYFKYFEQGVFGSETPT